MLIRALAAAAIMGTAPALAQTPNTDWPNYRENNFIITDYKFASGETLPQLKLHYRTLGSAERNAAGEIVNAVLLLQGNTGTGANWLRPTLADELFKDGEPLDPGRYFIIIPDALGRGGSSKPSDGLKGSFPHYRYHDMVDSVHRLVTEGLKVAHLRLVIGSSLGCMHSFLWAEMYPDLMDGIVGLSCQPVEISGRNWIMRRAAAEAIRHDPDWNNGNMTGTQPTTSTAPRRDRSCRRAPRASRNGHRRALPRTSCMMSGWGGSRKATPTILCGRSNRSRTTAPRPIFPRLRPRCC
jgi:homoserine O-acetyltransferase